MLTCPLCQKHLELPQRACPRCQADLSLLADLMTDVQTLLARAETYRKSGELAPAVQAYLEVLAVDPTNADARAALGPVLLAVRTASQVEPYRKASSFIAMILTLAIAVMAVGAGFAVVRLMI